MHVRDVAAADVAGPTRQGRPPFAAYNGCSGEPHSIADMAGAPAAEYGGPEPVVTGQYRRGDVRHIVAAPELAATELGFRARIGFAEGMAESARPPLRGAG